jgi:hypothetical protein
MESTELLGSLSGLMSAYSLSQGQLGWSMLLALKQRLDQRLIQDEEEDGKPTDGRLPGTPS